MLFLSLVTDLFHFGSDLLGGLRSAIVFATVLASILVDLKKKWQKRNLEKGVSVTRSLHIHGRLNFHIVAGVPRYLFSCNRMNRL